MRCGPPALPPPLGSSFPWWRRDRVCLPPLGSGRGGVDVLLAPRRAALALRCGRPLPPPPPRARRSPGADIAFDCRRHRVNGPRVAFGCRHCQGGVAVVASMAHASTDGLCDAARAAPRPPPALVIPLAPRSHSVAAVADEEWQSGVVKSMPEGCSILRRLST